MPYINSNSITVFPAVKRAQDYQKDARLLTEESVTRIQRLLNSSFDDSQAEHQGFVISTMEEINDSANNPNHYVEFIIGGYYVKVKVGDMGAGNGSTVWAFINVTQQGGYSELGGVDSYVNINNENVEKFMGVFFENSATQQTFSSYTHSLKILTVKGDFSTTQEVKEVFNRREGYSEDIVCSSLTTTGSGGIKVKDGASDKITLSQDGSVSAVTISSTGAITAGGGITSSGDISGVNITASGDISAAGDISATGSVTGSDVNGIRQATAVTATTSSPVDLNAPTYYQSGSTWNVRVQPGGGTVASCFNNGPEGGGLGETSNTQAFIFNSLEDGTNKSHIQVFAVKNIGSMLPQTTKTYVRTVYYDNNEYKFGEWTYSGQTSGDGNIVTPAAMKVGTYKWVRSGDIVTLELLIDFSGNPTWEINNTAADHVCLVDMPQRLIPSGGTPFLTMHKASRIFDTTGTIEEYDMPIQLTIGAHGDTQNAVIAIPAESALGPYGTKVYDITLTTYSTSGAGAWTVSRYTNQSFSDTWKKMNGCKFSMTYSV